MAPLDLDARRLPALDGIRGIAITLVMLLHAASEYFPGGAIGVDVFFALSAFLITSLILREYDTTGGFSFRRFYGRRARRLGPALLLWLILVAPVTAVAIGESGSILSSTLVSLLYVGNYAVGLGWFEVGGAYTQIWSLAIEEQFYLVWPVVLLLLASRLPRRAVVQVLTVLLTVGCLVQVLGNDTYFMPWGHSAGILGGCLLAVALRQGVPSWILRLSQSALMPVVLLIILAAVCLGIDRLPSDLVPFAFAAGGLAGCGLIGHAVLGENGVVLWALANPALTWLGRRSYGLYLYHRTLAILVPALVPGITLKLAGPVVLVISFALAEVSWRYVERPVLFAGKRSSRSAARESAES